MIKWLKFLQCLSEEKLACIRVDGGRVTKHVDILIAKLATLVIRYNRNHWHQYCMHLKRNTKLSFRSCLQISLLRLMCERIRSILEYIYCYPCNRNPDLGMVWRMIKSFRSDLSLLCNNLYDHRLHMDSHLDILLPIK